MAPRIIETGTARNLTVAKLGNALVPDPTERRFVTYATDAGAVHTIIVDPDHAADTPEALVDWHEKARTIIEHRPDTPPEDVNAIADHYTATGEHVTTPPEHNNDPGGDASTQNHEGGAS